jgi:choline/glycine/proline betaine transport protein
MKSWSFNNLNYYYAWGVGFYVLGCLLVALHPKWGKTKLGTPDGVHEFSNFSWFSMIFGAGIGIGMLGYATGEPMWHMGDNPEIRMSAEIVRAAFSSA